MDADISCGVCWQSYMVVEPVVLAQCAHTMCKPCALRIGAGLYAGLGGTAVKCPFCQQVSTYKSISDLKINYALRGLMQTMHEERGSSEEVINMINTNIYRPKKLHAGTRCRGCAWYLALQSKVVCSYCGETFCSKCSDIHFQIEQENYQKTNDEVRQKIQQTTASLELQLKSLEKRCHVLEEEKAGWQRGTKSLSESSNGQSSGNLTTTPRRRTTACRDICVILVVVIAYMYVSVL